MKSESTSGQPSGAAAIRPALRHLILVPRSGLCNRLRAIASARRLCQRLGARCTLVWDWGDFENLFQPMPDVEIVPAFSGTVDQILYHRHQETDSSRTIDVTVKTLEVYSGYVFWGSDEQQTYLSQLGPWLPLLHPRLEQRVDEFHGKHLTGAVGLHMRRTDNKWSIQQSPDRLFLEKAAEVIAVGKTVFLATDNQGTERTLKRRFGEAIKTYPKRSDLKSRWPRPVPSDTVVIEDDLIDLFLLAKTEYVLGSCGSSFSGVAMLLNRSKQCAFLKSPAVTWSSRIQLLLLQISKWRLLRKRLLRSFRRR